MTKYITSKKFIEKHHSLISKALFDYQSWWEKNEPEYKQMQKVINDFELIGGEDD